MQDTIEIIKNGSVLPKEIADVREAVGWDRAEEMYHRSLPNLYAYYTVRVGAQLIGYLGIVSDGVGDALIVDVVMHPDFQKQGLGKRLVTTAIQDLKSAGIRGVHVTFDRGLETFYRNLGFAVSLGGVIDFEGIDWPPQGESTSP